MLGQKYLPVGSRSSAEWAHRQCVSCQALRPAAPALQERFGGLPEIELGGGDVGAMGTWADTFRLTQGYEAWQALGAWITEARPAFGMGVSERFQMASKVSSAQACPGDAAPASQRVSQSSHLNFAHEEQQVLWSRLAEEF